MSGSSDFGTAAQEQFRQAIRQGQEAMLGAVRAWTESIQALAGTMPPAPDPERLPSLTEMVDNAYQFAEDLLTTQHRLARSVAEAMTTSAGAAVTTPGQGPEQQAPEPEAQPPKPRPATPRSRARK